jgi:hypothetical protein
MHTSSGSAPFSLVAGISDRAVECHRDRRSPRLLQGCKSRSAASPLPRPSRARSSSAPRTRSPRRRRSRSAERATRSPRGRTGARRRTTSARRRAPPPIPRPTRARMPLRQTRCCPGSPALLSRWGGRSSSATAHGPSQPLTFSYQWLRCANTGVSSCAPISGATANTYVLVAGDAKQRLRATVTATNGAGSTSATSAATSPVN